MTDRIQKLIDCITKGRQPERTVSPLRLIELSELLETESEHSIANMAVR